jgi:hypothetical protein
VKTFVQSYQQGVERIGLHSRLEVEGLREDRRHLILSPVVCNSEKALPEPEEASPKPAKPSISIIQQKSPYRHIPSPPGREIGQPNRKRTLPDSEGTASKPGETSPNHDALEQKWFQTLERLHHCQMSTKYAAAMSDKQGDWNFDRDVVFAMEVPIPWTKELLNRAGTPTADFFKNCRWLDTRDPGAYACRATKRDRNGKIIAVAGTKAEAMLSQGATRRYQVHDPMISPTYLPSNHRPIPSQRCMTCIADSGGDNESGEDH